MPTVVIGTAGHIDHGKTTLLRALTGIDADRLPEERERGMTIDVGFAHLDLDDGSSLDFVDVPGHDRLVGNMLVGAGEIDAVLLVVAADDGPRAQTLEHLELLSALGLRRGVVAVTKADVASEARIAEVAAEVRALVDGTSLAGAPIVEVSAERGSGLPELRLALVALRDAVQGDLAGRPAGPVRLPVDRAFTVRGRGSVVTGTLRGGSVVTGDTLRLVPGKGAASIRVREVQVHHGRRDRADGGRAALNLGGAEPGALRRGMVLTDGAGVEVSDRLLVALAPPVSLRHAEAAPRPTLPRPSAAARLHVWTATVDASIAPTGTAWAGLPGDGVAAIVRLAEPTAVMAGARGVLRDPGSARLIGSVTILDARPPRGVSRRRMSSERLLALASAIDRADPGEASAALVDLHGVIAGDRVQALAAALGEGGAPSSQPSLVRLSGDIEAALSTAAVELAERDPTLAEVRSGLLARLRRLATIERGSAALASAAIDQLLSAMVSEGRLRRDGGRLSLPVAAGNDARAEVEARLAALARLEVALDADVPPSLAEATRASGCGPDGVVALERSGRIVRVEDDLAWAASRYASLRDRALAMARLGPLAPAAFRDAIGGNRRVALALLEDLGRKGILRRTDAGHVPGPRASGTSAPPA